MSEDCSRKRRLMMANKDPMNSFNCIMSIAYPKRGKEIPDCMEDLCIKANKNILMIHKVKGLFGLQQSFLMNDVNVDIG